MTQVLTSLRATFAILVGARLLGAAGGILLGFVWQSDPARASVRAAPSALALFTGNVKGAATVAVLSGATGGLAGLAFNLFDGVRYGLTLAAGTDAVSRGGLAAAVAGALFPWLEFLAVSAAAAWASVLFWKLWFGRGPLIPVAQTAAIAAGGLSGLVVAASLEGWLLR